MLRKHLLQPQRLRQMPRQFSWVDQRLVRDHLLECCPAPAWGLYLLLIVVGDFQGLSYYSDASIQRRLSLSAAELAQARSQLQAQGFIAYQPPLYQVLELATHRPMLLSAGSSCRSNIQGHSAGEVQIHSAGEVLRQILGGLR